MQHGKVVAYASRQLKQYEYNYPTHDFELAKNRIAVSNFAHSTRNLIKDFEKLRLEVITPSTQTTTRIRAFMIRPTLRDCIKEAQDKDPFLQKIKAEIGTNKCIGFEVSADKAFTFKGILCVPKDEGIRNEILEETHSTPYAAHPGDTEMYQDL
ncbi:uncharacterized protein LOC111381207 [Olea europaea var. sylvestris]|uniref:uncharacterized protein LOC111381207 n=1 Tax=Olea europaea var. sylvestris TaxID=158386 RepID=UPI000C1D819D|nr:uncharacterized protein LOC111381207 [Olea europaea var. sylvestris]